MKVQSATQSTLEQKPVFGAHMVQPRQRESSVLMFAVVLAFAFVGSCVFTLG